MEPDKESWRESDAVDSRAAQTLFLCSLCLALNPKSSFHIGPGFHGVLLSFLSDCKRLTKAWLRPKGFVEAWKYLKGNDIVAAALSGGGLAANSR